MLTDHPLRRYEALQSALEQHRRWYEGALPLRYAGLWLASAPADPWKTAQMTADVADTLKGEAGWFHPATQLRWLLAAATVRAGLKPSGVLADIAHARSHFRSVKLRRGGFSEIAAAFLLVKRARGPIARADAERVKGHYEEMKRHHWWLTGPEDVPACALLASHRRSPEEACGRIERFWSLLTAERLPAGDPLQRSTHLLYWHPAKSESLVVGRFIDLRDSFRSAGVRMWTCDWDDLALLSLLDAPVSRIVRSTLDNRDAVLGLKWSVGRIVAFSLGASLTFLELMQPSEETEDLLDAVWMTEYAAILAQQQAAASAGAAGAAT